MTDTSATAAELAGVDEAVVVVNVEGVVIALSQAAQELAGVAADDLVGEYVEMLVPDALRWGHQRYRRGFLAEPSPREMDPGLGPCVQRPDGTLVPVAVQLVPHELDGRLYVAAHITAR